MKTLKEALFSRKNLNSNPFGLTKDDIKGDIKGLPMGVVVRMLEEQELQGNDVDINVFQRDRMIISKGFDWDKTEAGYIFWEDVLEYRDFILFFARYPKYKKYNL